jgi:SAM-dependent methyltransferase
MSTPHSSTEPSVWIRRFLPLLNRGSKVLDLACGNGRHTRLLLSAGHRVVAVDRDLGGVLDLADNDHLILVKADLEDGSPWPMSGKTFDAVVVANYLWRDLFPHLVAALAPGGFLIYETFAEGNERFGKPENPDFLLRKNELLEVVEGELEVIEYEHTEVQEPRPAVIQHICAMRKVAAVTDPDSEEHAR